MTTQTDAERWGIPYDAPELGVWPENEAAVRAFLRLRTLFRTPGPFGGSCGLDYTGVRPALEMAGIEINEDLWAQIQLIEQGAVEAVMERLS